MVEQPAASIPKNLPDPVIYGPTYPDLKLLLKGGRQIFESRTNQNLRLTASNFTPAGTFTMGQFMERHPLCCGDRRGWVSCPAVVERWRLSQDRRRATAIKLRPRIESHRCQFLTALRGFCPQSQRIFFDKYLDGHYLDAGFEEAFRSYVKLHGAVDVIAASHMIFRTCLAFPALIPEVWLAAIGSDRTAADERYLSEHPQRVDFVMLADGEKFVSEVDGPSHYAKFDDERRCYLASERIYTRNLRVERALRRQGWRIHRFSNWEVREADHCEFWRLTEELPDGDLPWLEGFEKSHLEEVAPCGHTGL